MVTDKMAALLLMFVFVTVSFAQTEWSPTSWMQCRTNDDCGNLDQVCCSITPALGKRQLVVDGDFVVYYCLPYKTEDAPWCELRVQYSPSTPNYYGLCPCGPGLQCTPTDDLDPQWYPRDTFGKCTPVM